MSGKKFRHFLNNLVRLTNAKSYLEIGVWAGSSFTSAISNNFQLVNAIAIDNFSEYGGPKDVFLNNVNRFKTNKQLNSLLYESDCWKIDRTELMKYGPFQVYFFDGPHEQQDHYRAMIEFYEFLADFDAVILVDDWNYIDVRVGTRSALSQLPLDVHYEREIFTSENAPSDVTTDWVRSERAKRASRENKKEEPSDPFFLPFFVLLFLTFQKQHNGLGVFVVSKRLERSDKTVALQLPVTHNEL